MDGPPYLVPPALIDEIRVSTAELAELERRWRKAMERRPRHIEVLTPLPRRVRLRLWASRQRDRLPVWLCRHDHPGAAKLIWRLTGAWR